MKTNNNTKTKHGLIIIIIFVLLLGISIYAVVKKNSGYGTQTANKINTNTQNVKTYSSEAMRFSIDVPLKFRVEEKFFRVTLVSDKGNIYIEKGGTNFENIDDYVNDLDAKSNSVTVNKKNIYINNLPAISGFVGNQKYYFIYANSGTIFTIFADSNQLFSDLDQIAQSFRYTP